MRLDVMNTIYHYLDNLFLNGDHINLRTDKKTSIFSKQIYQNLLAPK